MQLFAFGINHQTAPLAIREQVAFHAESMEQALRDLVGASAGEGSGDLVHLQPHRNLLQHRRPEQAIQWMADFHHLPRTN